MMIPRGLIIQTSRASLLGEQTLVQQTPLITFILDMLKSHLCCFAGSVKSIFEMLHFGF